MNFKKNLKRFMTLNRHHAEGFTLVELIVVIAILAILGGVAVPAYGGYVKKANMQADMTLISEIEHALTLAGYSGTFKENESGFIILSTNEAGGIEVDSNLEKALVATFGANYADTLKLKYDGWGNNGMLGSLLGEDAATAIANAKNVLTSPYLTGNTVDQLLSDVEDLTSAASGIVSGFLTGSNGDSTNTYNSVSMLFDTTSGSNAFDAAFTEVYGENGDKSKLTEDELANLLVLASAKEFNGSATETSGIGNLVGTYAMCVAYASTEEGKNNPNVQNAYADLQASLAAPKDEGDGYYAYAATAVDDFMKAMDAQGINSWMMDENGAPTTEMQNAMGAFSSIMTAVDSATMTPEELNNGTLFTEGKGNTLFNNYLDMAKMISNMAPEQYAALKNAGAGTIVVTFVSNGAGVTIANSATAT